MRLLLDIHILIWAATGDAKLSKAVAQLIDEEANMSMTTRAGGDV